MSSSKVSPTDLLERLMSLASTVWFTSCPDPDWPKFGHVAVHACFDDDATPRARCATATSAGEALERIMGIEEKFLCKKCGDMKSRRMFTFDKDRPRSRHPYCLECNARRSARYRQRKAAQEDALLGQIGLKLRRLKKRLATTH